MAKNIYIIAIMFSILSWTVYAGEYRLTSQTGLETAYTTTINQNEICAIAKSNPYTFDSVEVNKEWYEKIFGWIIGDKNTTKIIYNYKYTIPIEIKIKINMIEQPKLKLENNTFCYNASPETDKLIEIGDNTITIEYEEENYNPVTVLGYYIINVTAEGYSNLNWSIWNWEGTNNTIFDDSLILMMNMNNVTELGEGTNNKTVDVSSSGNNGTCYGMSQGCNWTSAGRYGGGMLFDGVNDRINASSINPLLSNTKNLSISAWFKTNSNATMTLVAISNGTGNGYFNLRIANTGWLQLVARNDSGTVPASSIAYIPDNQWHYAVGVVNVSHLQVYLDGVGSAVTGVNGNVNTNGFTATTLIGAIKTTSMSGYFNGTIDEVRIWNRSLSAAEISKMYKFNLNKYELDKWAFLINETITEEKIYNWSIWFANESGTEQQIGYFDSRVYPSIDFIPPTLQNHTATDTNFTLINISILNASDLSNFTWNWNGTSTTLYDDSLVLMYNFDNITAIGENYTSPTNKTVDASRYGNNGTCKGMSAGCNWTSAGRYAGGMVFDGVDDSIRISHSPTLNLVRDITISVWIYPLSILSSGAGTFVIAKRTTNIQTPYILLISTSKKATFSYTNSSTWLSKISARGVINNNAWSNIVITRNSTNVTFYHNGTFMDGCAALNDVINFTTQELSIGMSGDGYTGFNGTIDEVRIWNRSLGANEIKQVYYSNLNKYDTDKWLFYANETSLSDYTYNYSACAIDIWNNTNCTETREFISDSIPPTITSIQHSFRTPANYSEENISINITAQDAGILDTILFRLNSTLLTNTYANNKYTANIWALYAGNYSYNWTVNDSVGHTTSQYGNINISQYPTKLNITITPSENLSYGTIATVTGNLCNHSIACELYMNNAIVSNPYISVLSQGIYIYTFNTTGNQNYTIYSISTNLTIYNYSKRININFSETLFESTPPDEICFVLRTGRTCLRLDGMFNIT